VHHLLQLSRERRDLFDEAAAVWIPYKRALMSVDDYHYHQKNHRAVRADMSTGASQSFWKKKRGRETKDMRESRVIFPENRLISWLHQDEPL
jgi:hypothetical protein